MTPALASLLALVAAIVLSCTSQINVGLLAMALAWIIGVFVAGWSPNQIAGGFPTQLFLTLAGVTLLFAASETNGTIDVLARRAMRLARGTARLVPLLFFLIAMAISTVGPGAIAATALVVPIAMVLGGRYGIPALLIALMVANGANAGNLSALSSVGVVANAKMAEVGLGGHEWKVWLANFAAHAAVAATAWLMFGGLRLSGRPAAVAPEEGDPPLAPRQWITLAAIATWIVGVVVFETDIGFSAFAAALFTSFEISLLTALVLKLRIVMASSTFLPLMRSTTRQGLALFTDLLVRMSTTETVTAVVAFVTGVVSVYSSTSGVVLPTFLPAVPSLVEKVGGGDPLAVAFSINVGASLVDVSPLSTIGALCVAAVSDAAASRVLFRQLLIWGLAMTIVGALLCQWLAGPFARW